MTAWRCPECRTRRQDYGLFTRHVRESGHRACNCGGYHYAHRPGSPYCTRNPMADVLIASRQGESAETCMDIAADIAWSTPGRVSAECPF
ncbi:hypothetical protein [Hydrogenophaga sp.]|uniref:hypothetical protein n=1 Tax=Hydrogenophaga sp. TaxID=1904254 RepID=UPI0027305FE9|nr:hypothetical protein [Hydrogenophaga sp.]MDP1688033.1 hypothetical protein [Hydrogenophaga sp.]